MKLYPIEVLLFILKSGNWRSTRVAKKSPLSEFHEFWTLDLATDESLQDGVDKWAVIMAMMTITSTMHDDNEENKDFDNKMTTMIRTA